MTTSFPEKDYRGEGEIVAYSAAPLSRCHQNTPPRDIIVEIYISKQKFCWRTLMLIVEVSPQYIPRLWNLFHKEYPMIQRINETVILLKIFPCSPKIVHSVTKICIWHIFKSESTNSWEHTKCDKCVVISKLRSNCVNFVRFGTNFSSPKNFLFGFSKLDYPPRSSNDCRAKYDP